MSETQSQAGVSPGTALGAAGHLVDGIGAFVAGRARAAGLRADARARIETGEAQADDIMREGREAVAFGTVQAGASGFTVDGSALDVIGRLAQEADTASRRARWQSMREADKIRQEARSAKRGAIFGLAKGVLSAGASIIAGGG